MNRNTLTYPTVEQAYSQLFTQYAHQLCQLLYNRFGDYERARDITQDSFLKLWANRDTISYKKVKGYLFVVANNAYINSLNRTSVRDTYAKNHKTNPVSIVEAPDYKLEEKEFLATLQKAIAQLPAKQRQVLTMNRFENKSYKAIANELEVSIKTVEKRMQAAFKALSDAVGKDVKRYRL